MSKNHASKQIWVYDEAFAFRWLDSIWITIYAEQLGHQLLVQRFTISIELPKSQHKKMHEPVFPSTTVMQKSWRCKND